MDVRAILLVNTAASVNGGTTPGLPPGIPLAALDVLGRPVLHHVAQKLRDAGIEEIAVLSDWKPMTGFEHVAAGRAGIRWSVASADSFWRTAESNFSEQAQRGAELVLVIRLGAYADLDVDHLLQFHLDQRSRVTRLVAADGAALDIFVISTSRRNDAAFLLRNHLAKSRMPCAEYRTERYVNWLRGLEDLRRLAVDGLMLRAGIQPAGKQVRPGVWVGHWARIHRGARILAPAFIGARAKLGAGAVITRGSALEHHAHVDCGTVVENATLLPYSYVGAGLDVAHSVVGFRRLAHLGRNVLVEISDAKLVSAASPSAALRALSEAAELAAFLPRQLFKALRSQSQRSLPTQLPEAVQATSPAFEKPAPLERACAETGVDEFPNFAVARRYGDQ